jgi:uncharacterized protein YeaO (DUF488 family)
MDIKLNRASIRDMKKHKGCLNVTRQSAQDWAIRLAPTWRMVNKHKRGTISDKKYTELYVEWLNGLDDRSMFPINHLVDLAEDNDDEQITFICFCKDGKFCHTNILIDWLVANGHGLFRDVRAKDGE